MSYAIEHKDLFIAGVWRSSCLTMDIISPVTEQVLTKISAGRETDIQDAVSAARSCFEGENWGLCSTGEQRKKILLRIAELVELKKDYLAYLDHINMGKPMKEALVDSSDAAGYFRYYADLADKWDEPEPVSLPDENFQAVIQKEPLGVIAAITPWNYPLTMASQKIAAAFAAGCAVVLKTSEYSPLSALALAAICHEAGLPSGALSVISGGPEVGAALVKHPKVDKISFTGSEATGTRIMQEAANGVRGISLELGGKSPMIVFPDVDIPSLIDWIMIGFIYNAGQVCSATSRLIVHKDIHDKVVEELLRAISRVHVGPIPQDFQAPHIGPIVCEKQYNRVLGFIERAKEQGIVPIIGGSRPTNCGKGYYILPTVYDNVSTSAEIWNEEIFGPVLCIRTFESEAEAVTLANESRYGLAASVMTSDSSQPAFVQVPWGGYKASGIGRELSKQGLEEFLECKQVTSCRTENTFQWFSGQ